MNNKESEVRASLVSELLLYHAALGRGYISPFPATRGLVFSSALPNDALTSLAGAEIMFRRWHEESLADDRRALASMEEASEHLSSAMGMDKQKQRELKEKLSKRPHVTWKEDQVMKATLVELLKTHYYGAFTYLDPVGARLAASLSSPGRLSSDLGWTTLMEGTTDEALIRANATGGALIHSLAGADASFNYFCRCKEPQIEKLRRRIKESTSGQVGAGTSVLIPGRAGIPSGVGRDTLYHLMREVFALGAQPEDKRVRVDFTPSTRQGWAAFLSWGLSELIEVDEPSEWQVKISYAAPVSPWNAVLFGARAAMVSAFLNAFDAGRCVRSLELGDEHLSAAKAIARFLYKSSCGHEGFDKRIKNLKVSRENFITPQRLNIALRAMEEALSAAENHRVSRTYVHRSITGVTLGLLDELVTRGDIVELRGVEECQMGKTTKAYTLPSYVPSGSAEDAVVDFEDAAAMFEENPSAVTDSEALVVSSRLIERAGRVFAEHFLPVVPLSRMTVGERRMLPKILNMLPSAFKLRGVGIEPEPPVLLEDEDTPLDVDGLNLWVRYASTGEDFCDWRGATKLALACWA